jgi:hypothetical protein
MGKKKKNKGKKKLSAKKEKYTKFRKEKTTTFNFTPPELTPEQRAQRLEDEKTMAYSMRFGRNAPPKEIVERREKSKR